MFFLVTFLSNFQTFFQKNSLPPQKQQQIKTVNVMQLHGCRNHFFVAKPLHGNLVDWRYLASMQGLPRKIIKKEADS